MIIKQEIAAPVELTGPYEQNEFRPILRHGNVIKSKDISNDFSQKIGLSDGHLLPPEVVAHRKGEKVEYLHVTCHCGAKTAIKLEYDEE